MLYSTYLTVNTANLPASNALFFRYHQPHQLRMWLTLQKGFHKICSSTQHSIIYHHLDGVLNLFPSIRLFE